MSICTAQIKHVFSPGALQYSPHAVKIDCISCRNDGQLSHSIPCVKVHTKDHSTLTFNRKRIIQTSLGFFFLKIINYDIRID